MDQSTNRRSPSDNGAAGSSAVARQVVSRQADEIDDGNFLNNIYDSSSSSDSEPADDNNNAGAVATRESGADENGNFLDEIYRSDSDPDDDGDANAVAIQQPAADDDAVSATTASDVEDDQDEQAQGAAGNAPDYGYQYQYQYQYQYYDPDVVHHYQHQHCPSVDCPVATDLNSEIRGNQRRVQAHDIEIQYLRMRVTTLDNNLQNVVYQVNREVNIRLNRDEQTGPNSPARVRPRTSPARPGPVPRSVSRPRCRRPRSPSPDWEPMVVLSPARRRPRDRARA